MRPLLNVVGRRIPGADFDATRRWSADHIVQLFAFDGLRWAWLLQRRRDARPAGSRPAPDLLCLYDFGCTGSFTEYEASATKAAAAADRAVSWGHEDVVIASRSLHRRRLH